MEREANRKPLGIEERHSRLNLVRGIDADERGLRARD
jgi:hypothetical protein